MLHDIRTVSSPIACVGCGQGLALIPAGLKSLAPPGVAVRPLAEHRDSRRSMECHVSVV
jgi:hypothetical protein